MDKQAILKQFFGHSVFREGQEEIIDAILSGRDAIGIMPTGGGKSLCYQVPGLMLGGVTLVISPLISLMKDQVMALKNAGVNAAFLNSSLTSQQMQTAYRNIRSGAYKIIYVAPERLDGEGFVALIQSLRVSLVAVDEAHCISQWGQDFRPSYLRILDFIRKMPQRPVLAAFTATATKRVQDDIQRILQLKNPLKIVTGFDRPNLNFEVLHPSNKAAALHSLIEARPGQTGIVYCATRKNVESVCQQLQTNGIRATRYHAGLSDDERRKNQEDFIYDRCSVMAATNAFGMGIDKSNISYVIHYNMPKSLEAYYQEAGRAGRDGERADCLLLYSSGDVRTAKFLIRSSVENEELTEEMRNAVLEQDLERLQAMIGYCNTTACLRGYILEYFGQSHQKSCGNCGSCRGNFVQQDMTEQAQMILSCVKRAYDKLGYAVGATLIVRTLCGSVEQRVLELGLDKLSTYGLMKGIARTQIRAYMEQLETDGYLQTDPIHGGLLLTDKAGAVLFGGESVSITTKTPPAAEKKRRRNKNTPAEDKDNSLYQTLRALRFQLSQEANVPAYIIFSNAALADMAEKAPKTMSEFLEVSGVGEVKAQRYGKIFLKEIADYEEAAANGSL